MNIEDQYIRHNELTSEELFEMYHSLNFIYPAKWERLKPVFEIVRNHWQTAMKLKFPLFWVSTVRDNSNNIIATGTSWQYLNKGMLTQHLASNHPVGTRIIFLGMLNKVLENQHKGFMESYQLYYRPQNKYSNRIFECLSAKAGKEISGIIKYRYFEVPFLNRSEDLGVEQVYSALHPNFMNFLLKERGELFVKAQELNSDDIKLRKLNERFRIHGLFRRRKIFAATSPFGNEIYGVIIINQSSLGLNFSFFENSSELILSGNANAELLFKVAEKLLHKASEVCSIFPLQHLPVFIDPKHADIIERLNGKSAKDYNLFIMTKGGYEIWYDLVDQLTSTVFKRFMKNAYATEDIN